MMLPSHEKTDYSYKYVLGQRQRSFSENIRIMLVVIRLSMLKSDSQPSGVYPHAVLLVAKTPAKKKLNKHRNNSANFDEHEHFSNLHTGKLLLIGGSAQSHE